MDYNDIIAKAKELAQKYMEDPTALGKRKNRWEDDQAGGPAQIVKKKVFIPTENPEFNFLGLLIGPKGTHQKQIAESTGAKIVFRGKGAHRETGSNAAPHPDDDEELHVSIEGPPDAVEKARKRIEDILFNPEEAMKLKQEQLKNLSDAGSSSISSSSSSEYSEEMFVPNKLVGLIIGKNGESVQKLIHQSGANMQIAKENEMKPGSTERSIMLRGHPLAVADLKRRIEEIVISRSNNGGVARDPRANATTTGAGGVTLTNPVVLKVMVPNEKVGIIIGRGGTTVKSIQDKTRTTIFIPPNPDEGNESVRTIQIGADTREAAEGAQLEIFLAVQQFEQNGAKSGHAPPMTVMIPDNRVGLVIGKSGVIIKDISTRNKVKVTIPPTADPDTNPPMRSCSIAGTLEGQTAARYEIELILQGQGHMVGGGNAGAGGNTGYGAPVASAPYSSYGPASGYGHYDPYQGYYGAAATANPAAAAPAASRPQPDPSDPTAYYNDFWVYAQYYGESMARAYYGAWSPPVGTAPPPGVVLPADTSASAASGYGASEGPSSSTSDGANASTEASSAPSAAAAPASTGASSEGLTDLEKYERDYAKWYEEYGQYTDAPKEPPRPY